MLAIGCAEPREQARSSANAQETTTTASECAARVPAPDLLPGTKPEQLSLDYWLARYDSAALDAPLLTAEEIEAYNALVGRRPGSHVFGQRDLLVAPDLLETEHDVSERLAFLRTKLGEGEYVVTGGGALPDEALAAFRAPLPTLEPVLRVALADTQLRCGPYPGPLYSRAGDERYDRNACSTLRGQEVVELLARWPGGMFLARTRYALGWMEASASLSPFVPPELREPFVRGPRAIATRAYEVATPTGERVNFAERASVPLVDRDHFALAGATHFHRIAAPAGVLLPTRRALTRRELLTAAFAFLGSPYGFGGARGGHDCSSLQLELFERFDIALPRHSNWQAKAGSYRFDVAGLDDAEKLRLVDAAARDGAVLLGFPGHVMLYLGESAEGRPMVLHALGEFARPCAGGGESIVDVQRVVVSDLELGRGSSRGALVERITSAVVLGRGPSAELAARARLPNALPTRPDAPETCRDSLDRRIFVSPREPQAGRPVRVIATASDDDGDAELWLWSPDGAPYEGAVHTLGGPPYAKYVRVAEAAPGAWTAVLARGNEVLACKRFRAGQGAGTPPERATDTVWATRWAWERDTENLWSAFVEQLFDYPLDDSRTWTSLHELLRDPERNLLHDHLGLGEDARIELVPDCADLPYALRAYFAWKLSLPYGYRQCSRGRTGQPPSCGELHTNLEPPAPGSEVEAFDRFVNRSVRSGVHSASGRTHPDDDATDLYPVALERRALAPGTVYADPYGHVLIVTRWVAQGGDAESPYGVLVAAEGQPDGTVGRRRFWEGSFLFDPSTRDVGAGFKRFRPIVWDREASALRALTNDELAEGDEHVRWNRAQYEGSRADFYERMDALVNPTPLGTAQRLASLADALEESAARRVLAVDNGEQWVAEHPGSRMPMPTGHAIFETAGPWEDFATPSRDMRLLIAIDTVLDLPERVRRSPERFGVAAAELESTLAELRTKLDAELARRRFSYTKSDGSAQSLTLADVVARQEALEVAYNPNDCVELRWGAPEGSAELASCKRRAPPDQQTRMQRYRTWFRTRTRPARGAHEPVADAHADLIRIHRPRANDPVGSPLVIEGAARGSWYFEATFPVRLIDADGRVLAQHYAQAQGEWMTERFVPFRAELSYERRGTTRGSLVLEKANASGLPEHANAVRIPVRFAE